MIKIKSDKIIFGNGFFSGCLYVNGGKIADVTTESVNADAEYDFTGKYVSPDLLIFILTAAEDTGSLTAARMK